jgi:hypothetical protein
MEEILLVRGRHTPQLMRIPLGCTLDVTSKLVPPVLVGLTLVHGSGAGTPLPGD